MEWAEIGAVGSAIAGLGALAAAGVAAWQLHASTRYTALTWLYGYLEERKKQEASLQLAFRTDDGDQAHHAFVELLNFLEATALAYNSDLVPRRVRPQIHKDLRKAVAEIETSDFAEDLLEALSDDDSLENLRSFLNLNRPQIERRKSSILSGV